MNDIKYIKNKLDEQKCYFYSNYQGTKRRIQQLEKQDDNTEEQSIEAKKIKL